MILVIHKASVIITLRIAVMLVHKLFDLTDVLLVFLGISLFQKEYCLFALWNNREEGEFMSLVPAG
ncbi:MAG TPA: hypothetical protein VJ695_07775 [Nitrososphaera sp.]|nr:hypothetical protein [Nitrososphaera sp.]